MIAQVGIVYNLLERSDQKKLLRHIVSRVVIDCKGMINLELRAPFSYLQDIRNWIGESGNAEEEQGYSKTKTSSKTAAGFIRTECSLTTLTCWAAKRFPLADWLVNELRLKYRVPRKTAQDWVEREQLLLLLDGLDEVAQEWRSSCVEAINHFRRLYSNVDLAVCSRIEEYDAITEQLDLRGAITFALTETQIGTYLESAEYVNLRELIHSNPEIRAMAEAPFLLNTMAYAYQDATTSELSALRNSLPGEEYQKHLFDRFVNKHLGESPNAQYSVALTKRYLAWLAHKMKSLEKTTFNLEELSAEWLQSSKSSGRQRLRWYMTNLGTFFAYATPFFTISLWSSILQLSMSLISQTENPLRSFQDMFLLLVVGLLYGVGAGVIISLLIGVLFTIITSRRKSARPIESVSWSWRRFRWGGLFFGLTLGPILGFALAIGMGAALLDYYPDTLFRILFSEDYRNTLLNAVWQLADTEYIAGHAARLGETAIFLSRNLPVTLGIWIIIAFLLGGVILALGGSSVPARFKPNQGTKLSFRYSAITGFLIIIGFQSVLFISLVFGDIGAKQAMLENRLVGWTIMGPTESF